MQHQQRIAAEETRRVGAQGDVLTDTGLGVGRDRLICLPVAPTAQHRCVLAEKSHPRTAGLRPTYIVHAAAMSSGAAAWLPARWSLALAGAELEQAVGVEVG